MGRITSNVGLITGIPITDTVDQLMQVAGRPRDLLQTRNQDLQQQQLAINTLSTRLLSLQFDLGKLNVRASYESRTVASANEDLLTAVLADDGKPPIGEYAVRPVQTATAQQFVSQRFDDVDDLQSAGSFSFGVGGFVDQGISLDELNEGAGVSRGKIKITDLAGNSSVVDLSLVRSVDDVLAAINADTTINVTASVDGDSFVVTDNIGGGGTLTVQEVAGGSTAADLGLAGISTATSTATGADLYRLYAGVKLSRLNDGNGVRTSAAEVDDLAVTLTDGTIAGVDLSDAKTLGDVIDAINSHEDLTGKITAAIAADGNGLELVDNSAGGGTFSVAAGVSGSAAADLGIVATAPGITITGERLVSGLRDTLLATLNGGQGFDALGEISITDRSGGAATVDLSSAVTLNDVVDAINASAAQATASINDARNGILIADVSGGNGNLIVANNDATNTADALGIAVDAVQASVTGGSLNRQTLSEATRLSSLNGGEGITASDISITDTNGKKVSIDLNKPGSEPKTIGDLIDAINDAAGQANVQIEASLNAAGDGIQIVDSAFGTESLGVKDVNGSLAADLNLTRASKTVDVNGVDTQVVDGTSRSIINLADLQGSQGIVLSSLNDGAGVTFSDIRITDSQGEVLSFDLNGVHSGVTTVEQLVDALNADAAAQSVGVVASINAKGTGILLADNAVGPGNLKVEDINGTAAADLKILSNDQTTTTIDGAGLFEAQIASQGALDRVAAQINDLEAGVTASTFFDGSGYRLSLVVDQTGKASEVLLDAGLSGFKFEETTAARDALVVLGDQPIAGSGVLISSSTNEFEEIINGVNLTVVGPSETPINVSVAATDEDILAAVEDFVAAYNAIRSDLDELTSFNEDDLTTGLLFGTNEALRVDTELSRLITDRYFGLGGFTSLEQIGLSVDDSGKLELNQADLKKAFADDPGSLQKLFADKTGGVVAKFNDVIDRLADANNGLLTNRNNSLQATIENNLDRIESFNDSLDRQRERLLLEFFQLEQIIAQLQTGQQALSSLQPIPPLGSSN